MASAVASSPKSARSSPPGWIVNSAYRAPRSPDVSVSRPRGIQDHCEKAKSTNVVNKVPDVLKPIKLRLTGYTPNSICIDFFFHLRCNWTLRFQRKTAVSYESPLQVLVQPHVGVNLWSVRESAAKRVGPSPLGEAGVLPSFGTVPKA